MKRVVTRLLAIILLTVLLVQGAPVAVQAAPQEGGVRLKGAEAPGGERFAVENMYPGDSASKVYEVTTVHNQPTTLYFRVDIHAESGSEKNRYLRDQLWITVAVEGNQRYNGLLTEMPEFGWELRANDKKTDYAITVSLPTSAGNECADARVVVDFVWWYSDVEGNPVKLHAQKLVNKKYAEGDDFTFVVKDQAGNVVRTAKNQDENIFFDALYFSKPGEYVYTIHEVKGRDKDITYDDAVYRVIITVDENGKTKVRYRLDGEEYRELPRFINVTKGNSKPDHPSDVSPDSPKTGDQFPLKLLLVIMGSAALMLIFLFLLWKDRKKEDEHENQ